jgi:outer membrane protein assembly factor BamD
VGRRPQAARSAAARASARRSLWEAEAQFALGNHLQAAREFRKVSDDTPNDPLAPEALLRTGDVYADLWRKPELDPSYGQTALATYQELLNRYPGTPAAKRAQQRIDELQERFAYKEYKAALYYIRLKAYDSAILYLKDLVATYPRSSVAPDALIRLVQAYRTLGYKEDVQETCGYIRRFHPKAPGVGKACSGTPAAS